MALDDIYTLLNINMAYVAPAGRRSSAELLQIRARSVSVIASCVLPFAFTPRVEKGWHLRDDIDKDLDTRLQLVQCGFPIEFVNSFDSVTVAASPTRSDLISYIKMRGDLFFAEALGAELTNELPVGITDDAAELLIDQAMANVRL